MGAGQNAMLLPILTQILLVLVMYGALQIAKARASKAGLVDDARREQVALAPCCAQVHR